MNSLKIIKVALLSRNRKKSPGTKHIAIKYHHFQSFVQKKIFGYATLIQENEQRKHSLIHSTKHYSFIYEENYIYGETFDSTRGSLGIQTSKSNSQPKKLKWQCIFRNASERFLLSLKSIILILTVFINFSLERTVFPHYEIT